MRTHDIVLVGGGPAHLALLVHLERILGRSLVRHCRVLETREHFDWHPDMVVSGASLQISSFLKDLVTLCDPTNKHTFLNYLKSAGLLDRSVHLNTFHPSRDLFRRYLSWVAEQFRSVISYRCTVEAVRVTASGYELSVHTPRGRESLGVNRGLSLALGATPMIPENLRSDDPRVFHSSCFLQRLAGLKRRGDGKYLVVGAGQSAGEIVRHLLVSSPDSVVHVVSRGYLFQQIDDNPFVNDLYSDADEKVFFRLPQETRRKFLSRLRNSNFGVVDRRVAEDIYRLDFEARTANKQRLYLHSHGTVSRIVDCETGPGVILSGTDRTSEQRLEGFDAIIAATGYRDDRVTGLLGDVSNTTPDARIETDEEFRIKGARGPGIFLLNHDCAAHGLTEGTMAGLAGRAARVATALTRTVPRHGPSGWTPDSKVPGCSSRLGWETAQDQYGNVINNDAGLR